MLVQALPLLLRYALCSALLKMSYSYQSDNSDFAWLLAIKPSLPSDPLLCYKKKSLEYHYSA